MNLNPSFYKIYLFFLLCLLAVQPAFAKDKETSKPTSKKESKKEAIKQDKVLELIQNREQELKDKISDFNELYKNGLVTLQEAGPFKEELAELEQFEFIIKNPYTNSYEKSLKEKLTIRLEALKKEICTKEALSAEGLIASKDISSLQDKAALYNYILEFLMDESRIPVNVLKANGFNSKMILGRFFPIESKFGFRVDPINPGRKQFHAGIDFPAWTGNPIIAPFPGVVVRTVNSLNSGGGRKVTVRHSENFETVYMHLSEIKVKQGQKLKVSDLIGYVGSTGYRVTGPHLHFEIHINGIPVNPEKFLKK
ncbi:MAG: M23 family metallopeptidase [Candidatus Caenarcaniphilales bacterium]|nr:M23 family metallopeptidase [Candidatus Caenarcaniphilales bacterium]